MVRILLVDDEPLITDSLSYSLKREGFDVRAVGDGEQALKDLHEFDPDLVVLDIMLPGINGLEVCRRIRATGSTPVIMLTARGEEMDRILGLEVGSGSTWQNRFHFASFWRASDLCSSGRRGDGPANHPIPTGQYRGPNVGPNFPESFPAAQESCSSRRVNLTCFRS